MTELTFLIELLLEHKLPAATRKLISERIKQVEVGLSPRHHSPSPAQLVVSPNGPVQAPSMLAIMARNPDLIPPEPVAVIAQTPVAAAAMNSRATAIAASLSGKPEKDRTSPRKF